MPWNLPTAPQLDLLAQNITLLADQPDSVNNANIYALQVQLAALPVHVSAHVYAQQISIAVRADHKEGGGFYPIAETNGAEDTDVIYSDLIFPRCISYGSTGSPNYVTDKVEVDSGAEQRNQRRAYPRHEYSISMEGLPADEVSEIMNLWHVCAGDYIGFLFLDPMDHTSANTVDSLSGTTTAGDDQFVAAAIGTQSEYEIYKYYKSGLRERKRRIRYPDKETLTVFVSGFEINAWEFSYETCMLGFTKPIPVGAAANLFRSAGGAITGANFSALNIGDLVYITGFDNNAYNAPSGGSPARVTYASNSELRVQKFDGTAYGGAATSGAAVLVKSALPPTGATITCGYYFYTPVRFDGGDNMQGQIKSGMRDSAIADFTSITLREVFE